MDPTPKAIAFQYGAAISAGLSAMASGAWLAWPSSSIKPLTDGSERVVLEPYQISTLVALMDFGNILSPIPSSYLMDCIGRKLTLLTTSVLYILSSVCALIANNVWYLYGARVLAGLGKGVAFAVVPIFLGEVANTKIRGALSTMFVGFLNIGMVYDYVIGPYVSYQLLNVLNLVIPVLFTVTFWLVPESPYYLIMKGREGSARASLSKFRCVKKQDAGEGTPLDSELKSMVVTVERDMKNKARCFDIFTTHGNRRALIIISFLAIFQRLSGISPTLAYSTTIMPPDGGGLSSSTYMIIFSVILVAANFLATPLVDNAGRKILLIISSLSSSVVMAAAGIFYYIDKETSHDTSGFKWVPYACLLLFGITYSLGIGFLPSTLVAELFPTNVKSYAGSVSAILLAATSFCVNKMFQAVSDKFGVYVMYAIFSTSSFLAALFVIFFVFETKGKSFAEIQDTLNRTKKYAHPIEPSKPV